MLQFILDLATISQRFNLYMLGTYGNFKVDHLVGECRHLIAEAELVLADLFRSEDIVSLPFLLTR